MTQDRQSELAKARRYLDKCEDAVTNAIHCDDATFRAASAALRQAQERCDALEGSAVTRASGTTTKMVKPMTREQHDELFRLVTAPRTRTQGENT